MWNKRKKAQNCSPHLLMQWAPTWAFSCWKLHHKINIWAGPQGVLRLYCETICHYAGTIVQPNTPPPPYKNAYVGAPCREKRSRGANGGRGNHSAEDEAFDGLLWHPQRDREVSMCHTLVLSCIPSHTVKTHRHKWLFESWGLGHSREAGGRTGLKTVESNERLVTNLSGVNTLEMICFGLTWWRKVFPVNCSTIRTEKEAEQPMCAGS